MLLWVVLRKPIFVGVHAGLYWSLESNGMRSSCMTEPPAIRCTHVQASASSAK